MKKLIYPAIFTPDKDGGFTVEVPDLPGCVTEGDDIEESISMAQDAASGWILGELKEGNSVPPPSSLIDIEAPDGSFKSLIKLDIDSYSKRYGNKSVKS